MSELKPCPNPACGSKGRISWEAKNALCDSESYARVYCTNMSCGMSRIPVSVEDWNSRPIEDTLRAENERLMEALRWRKYPEEKPKSGDWCLVMAGSRKDAGLRRYYGGDESWYHDKHLSKVTHWLPIPPLEEDK